MSFPKYIKIKNSKLPSEPGVYFYYGNDGKLLYVGKATSLKRRVSSYFTKQHEDPKTQKLVQNITRIDYQTTETAIEALVLEANMIRKFMPPYNIKGKDDKTFLYLCITREKFPRPLLYRGGELEGMNQKKLFSKVFGPYTSGMSLRTALKLIRKSIPFSTDIPPEPGKTGRPCFYYHIKQCPGVCIGAISQQEYKKNIRDLIRFFSGKKKDIIRDLKREMKQASDVQEFERAALLRNRLYALTHIRDVALISSERTVVGEGESKLGRIEAYDISNISGTNSVGSMTVAVNGELAPKEYRMFKIRTVKGPNDFASMEEVLSRRFSEKNRAEWGMPDLIVIDGGLGQIHAARKVLNTYGIDVPLVGLAKGFDRKQDVLTYDVSDKNLKEAAEKYKVILQKVRDEAHRFAVKYHRKLRARGMVQ